MNSSLPPIKVFAGTKSRYMAEEICNDLGVELGKMNIQRFADGEFEVSLKNLSAVAKFTSYSRHSPTATTSWNCC